jgi:hypothetical protein
MGASIDAILTGADLRGADLTGADFLDLSPGARLTDARRSGTTLIGADLRVTDLTRADFCDADLSNADLSGVTFAEPPTYCNNTSFPVSFDPVAAGWTLDATRFAASSFGCLTLGDLDGRSCGHRA